MSPNIGDIFQSIYLKASDLQGQEPVVTLDRVEFEPVGAKKEMKGILYFAGKKKGLVLNKTNARKIIDITGSAITEQWRGIRVRLYVAETQYAGEVVDGIRIKAVGQAVIGMTSTPPPAPAPVTNEWAVVPDPRPVTTTATAFAPDAPPPSREPGSDDIPF